MVKKIKFNIFYYNCSTNFSFTWPHVKLQLSTIQASVCVRCHRGWCDANFNNNAVHFLFFYFI